MLDHIFLNYLRNAAQDSEIRLYGPNGELVAGCNATLLQQLLPPREERGEPETGSWFNVKSEDHYFRRGEVESACKQHRRPHGRWAHPDQPPACMQAGVCLYCYIVAVAEKDA